MYYSVHLIHLHYTNMIVSQLQRSLALGFVAMGLGLGHSLECIGLGPECLGLGLGLEALSLESKSVKTAEQRTIIQQYGDMVHWPLMGGLLHLVQRGGAWVGCGPAQSPPRCTKCNSPPINGQCTNLLDVAL